MANYQSSYTGAQHDQFVTRTQIMNLIQEERPSLLLGGITTNAMTADSANPKITFSESTESSSGIQPVHIIYTDYDSYRTPAGLKIIGGTDASPAWFEVEGAFYSNGPVHITPQGSHTWAWTEGIRLHTAPNGWTSIALCGTDNTGATGTSANTWSIHTYQGNFYITKNGSNTGAYRFQNTSNVWAFCNNGSEPSYMQTALQIREYNYGGAQGDTWGNAPRLGWHWQGRVAAQIGLASNGYLYEAPSTGTTFYQITTSAGSSRLIKHDIQPLPEMGDKIDKLEPVSFIYNDLQDQGTRYGLIHEDTYPILPDVCKFDEFQHGGKIINYTDLIPVLIKEIQSLRKRIKHLEEKNG